MVRRFAAVLSLLVLASCAENGDFKNPFVKQPPFTPSAVPTDFAILVDEGHFTFTTRQHVQQVLTAADNKSRTTYTNFQELNDAVRERHTDEADMTPAQLQDLWNEVARRNLMGGGAFGINWRADSDFYKENHYTVQIRANGQTRTYQTKNGFNGSLRDLMVMVQGVRLPGTQNSTTPVVGGGLVPSATATAPSSTQP